MSDPGVEDKTEAEPLDNLRGDDFKVVAEMHKDVLPRSTPSRLGSRYLESLYRYFARSPEDRIFVHRHGEEIQAVCVLSLAPSSLQRRMALHTRLFLYLPMLLAKVPLKTFLAQVFHSDSEQDIPASPEVVFIFSRTDKQSGGVGRALIARCENFLRRHGHREYYIRTHDDPGNRAISFYDRLGFLRHAEIDHWGQRYVVMVKPLRSAGESDSKPANVSLHVEPIQTTPGL